MVFFNCGTCGQGLKKNQIEKHLFSCKTNFFSCIDCGSDFKNNEYVNHNKCISEAKKYESKSYVEKATKGELKQNAWFEKVLNAINNSNPSPKTKILLQKLQEYPNIPRKKAKFINFVRNSFRFLDINEKVILETWNIIDSIDSKNNTSKVSSKHEAPPTLEEVKSEVNQITNVENNTIDENVKFDWLEAIKNSLLKKEKKEIKIKRLKKKILKQYNSHLNNDDDQETDKLNKKLYKKLDKYSNYFELIKNENDEIIKIKLIEN